MNGKEFCFRDQFIPRAKLNQSAIGADIYSPKQNSQTRYQIHFKRTTKKGKRKKIESGISDIQGRIKTAQTLKPGERRKFSGGNCECSWETSLKFIIIDTVISFPSKISKKISESNINCIQKFECHYTKVVFLTTIFIQKLLIWSEIQDLEAFDKKRLLWASN